MIIRLIKGGTLQIIPMRVPELQSNISIEYDFEINTEHLLPMLYIEGAIHVGNKIKVPLVINKYKTPIMVQLLNGDNNVVYTYKNDIACHKYYIFGHDSIRPDFDYEIDKLKAEQYTLRDEIKRLQEIGEVI